MRALTTYTSAPVQHRPDAHSLRCEFRRLVNAGIVSASSYDAFVVVVDTYGGLGPAIRLIREEPKLLA